MHKKWIKRIGIMVIFFAGAATATAALAASPVKIILNGEEIKADVPIQIVKGQTMVPLRWLAGALGAEVEWNGRNQTVTIDEYKKQMLQIKANRMKDALEEIVVPGTPEEAVAIWARGVDERNAAIQYAVMSPELRAQNISTFDELNWVTGVSSPWVEDYQLTNKKLRPDGAYEFDAKFHMRTSAEDGIEITRVLVKNLKGSDGKDKWLIDRFIETSQTELLGYHISVNLPAGWDAWRKTPGQDYYILDEQGKYIGDIKKLAGYYLPEHSEILDQKKLDGAIGNEKLVVLKRSQPNQSDTTGEGKEVHLFVPLDGGAWLDFYVRPASEAEVGNLQDVLQKIAKEIKKAEEIQKQ